MDTAASLVALVGSVTVGFFVRRFLWRMMNSRGR